LGKSFGIILITRNYAAQINAGYPAIVSPKALACEGFSQELSYRKLEMMTYERQPKRLMKKNDLRFAKPTIESSLLQLEQQTSRRTGTSPIEAG